MESQLNALRRSYALALPVFEWVWGGGMNLGFWDTDTSSAKIAHQNLYDFVNAKLDLSNSSNHLLDLGCGSGNAEAYLCSTFGHNITGVTLGSVLRAAAVRRCKGLNCQFINADFHKLPLFEHEFDGAFAIESLFHSHDKLSALRHWSTKLKPGARLVIVDYFLTDKSKTDEEQSDLKTWFEGYQIPSLLFLNDSLNEIAEKAGFYSITFEKHTKQALPGAIKLSNTSRRMSWLTVPLAYVFSDFKAVNTIPTMSRLLENEVVSYGCWILIKK